MAEPERTTPSTATTSALVVTTVAATIRYFLCEYATHLRSAGWRVDAAAKGATLDERILASFDNAYELPLSRSLRDGRSLLRGERAITRLLAETTPDLVHVHSPIASFLARLAVRRMAPNVRPAVAYTAHGFHFHRGGSWLANTFFILAERLAGRWTDRLVVMNDEDEAAARRHRLVPPRKLVRMRGVGLDTGWYSPTAVALAAASSAQEAFAIPADAPVFVIVAEFSRRKRVADGIAALAQTRHRDAHLVLLGDGPLRADIERQIDRLGVADRVILAGVVDDIRPFVASAVALMLCSDREGLPRAIMEALALEVPVIASSARGNGELVRDSGFVVEVGDVAGFARAMDWLIDHPQEARAMGRRGRERMVAEYELRLLLEQHDELYRGMLAERSARRRARDRSA